MLKEQKDDFLMQIETDDQVEVPGPKHKHRLEKNRGTTYNIKTRNVGEDQLADSGSKGLSRNDSVNLKGPQSQDNLTTNLNTAKIMSSVKTMSK